MTAPRRAMPIASLPMYDLPEVAAATDAWWQGLARAFRHEGLADAPERLARDMPFAEAWRAADLLFAQTCGYPLTHGFRDRLRLVATPCYDAPGCAGASYCSTVVVAADAPARGIADLRGSRCAVNGEDSQSGYSALRALVAPFAQEGRFFGAVLASGSHVASLRMVAAGEADVAAIDCVTHALVARHRPSALAGTRLLCRSGSAPGLPYVTALAADADRLRRLRAGLQRALADPGLAAARDELLLVGAEELPLEAYERIDAMEAEAIARGYPRVA